MSEVRKLMQTDIKNYFKLTITKIMQYQHKNRQTDNETSKGIKKQTYIYVDTCFEKMYTAQRKRMPLLNSHSLARYAHEGK